MNVEDEVSKIRYLGSIVHNKGDIKMTLKIE